jgi:hypothetical protein
MENPGPPQVEEKHAGYAHNARWMETRPYDGSPRPFSRAAWDPWSVPHSAPPPLSHLVDDVRVAVAGDETRADTLDLVWAGLASRQHGALCRLHRHHQHVGVLLLQVAARARDGATGAHAAHQDVHLTRRVLPDLRARRQVVHLPPTTPCALEPTYSDEQVANRTVRDWLRVGDELTRPFRDAHRFPSRGSWPVPRATRTPRTVGRCASFKGPFSAAAPWMRFDRRTWF